MISLVDSHAHIHGSEYDADRDAVIARARAAGVSTIVTAGTDVATSTAAAALAEAYPAIWATAGVHPHEAAAVASGDLERIEQLAGRERIVAVGEIGLDFHYDFSPREAQRRVFEAQLALADRVRLPVVIHSRDAEPDTFAMLTAWSVHRRAAGFSEPFGVMHCYAYGPGRLAAYADLGLFISVPGIVTYPKAAEMQASAAAIPVDKLLLETDCPYLTPQSRRGKRNEPGLLAETAARVAALRGQTVELVAAESSANARRLFGLPAPIHEPSGSEPAVSDRASSREAL